MNTADVEAWVGTLCPLNLSEATESEPLETFNISLPSLNNKLKDSENAHSSRSSPRGSINGMEKNPLQQSTQSHLRFGIHELTRGRVRSRFLEALILDDESASCLDQLSSKKSLEQNASLATPTEENSAAVNVTFDNQLEIGGSKSPDFSSYDSPENRQASSLGIAYESFRGLSMSRSNVRPESFSDGVNSEVRYVNGQLHFSGDFDLLPFPAMAEESRDHPSDKPDGNPLSPGPDGSEIAQPNLLSTSGLNSVSSRDSVHTISPNPCFRRSNTFNSISLTAEIPPALPLGGSSLLSPSSASPAPSPLSFNPPPPPHLTSSASSQFLSLASPAAPLPPSAVLPRSLSRSNVRLLSSYGDSVPVSPSPLSPSFGNVGEKGEKRGGGTNSPFYGAVGHNAGERGDKGNINTGGILSSSTSVLHPPSHLSSPAPPGAAASVSTTSSLMSRQVSSPMLMKHLAASSTSTGMTFRLQRTNSISTPNVPVPTPFTSGPLALNSPTCTPTMSSSGVVGAGASNGTGGGGGSVSTPGSSTINSSFSNNNNNNNNNSNSNSNGGNLSGSGGVPMTNYNVYGAVGNNVSLDSSSFANASIAQPTSSVHFPHPPSLLGGGVERGGERNLLGSYSVPSPTPPCAILSASPAVGFGPNTGSSGSSVYGAGGVASRPALHNSPPSSLSPRESSGATNPFVSRIHKGSPLDFAAANGTAINGTAINGTPMAMAMAPGSSSLVPSSSSPSASSAHPSLYASVLAMSTSVYAAAPHSHSVFSVSSTSDDALSLSISGCTSTTLSSHLSMLLASPLPTTVTVESPLSGGMKALTVGGGNGSMHGNGNMSANGNDNSSSNNNNSNNSSSSNNCNCNGVDDSNGSSGSNYHGVNNTNSNGTVATLKLPPVMPPSAFSSVSSSSVCLSNRSGDGGARRGSLNGMLSVAGRESGGGGGGGFRGSFRRSMSGLTINGGGLERGIGGGRAGLIGSETFVSGNEPESVRL